VSCRLNRKDQHYFGGAVLKMSELHNFQYSAIGRGANYCTVYRAYIAGRLNPNLDPEAGAKPGNLYSKCGGG
jgi:hypothetical protein